MGKMKLNPTAGFLIFLMAVAIVFIVYAATLDNFQAALVPICAASLIVILSIIEIVREIKTIPAAETSGQTASNEKDQVSSREFGRRVGLLSAWVGGLIAGIYYLGFLIANPIFLFAFLKSRGTGWSTSFLVTAIASAALYGFFEVLLERRLWRGQLFW